VVRGVLTEPHLGGSGLSRVVLGRAGAVAVHVLHLLGVDPALLKRTLDCTRGASALRVRGGGVVAVGRQAVTHDLSQHRSALLARHLLAHEHEHAAALTEREALAVERVRGGGIG
jgi:hypothetical protein